MFDGNISPERESHTGNWKGFKYVSTLDQPKYFTSLRICIFYTINANAMTGQGLQGSPTVQHANTAKINLDHTISVRCTVHDFIANT